MRPSRSALTCLTFDDNGVMPLGKEPVGVNGNYGGFVSSAGFGYTVGCGIAYAWLPADISRLDAIEIEYWVPVPRQDRRRTDTRGATIRNPRSYSAVSLRESQWGIRAPNLVRCPPSVRHPIRQPRMPRSAGFHGRFIDQQIDEVEQPRIVSNQNDHVDTRIQDVHDLENRLCAGKVDIVVLKQSRRNLKCPFSDFSRLHGTYSSGGQNQVWRESLFHK